MDTPRICIKVIGSLAQQLGSKKICREITRCTPIGELLSRIFEEKSIGLDYGDVVAYYRGRVVGLDEDICDYDEITITRLVRGG